MLIRAGFELIFEAPAPAPMILLLSIHPEREGSIRHASGLNVEPPVPIFPYFDSYGNLGLRLVTPAGRLRLWGDTIVEDHGQPDPVALSARQIPIQELPPEVLIYLLSSRFCEVERLV